MGKQTATKTPPFGPFPHMHFSFFSPPTWVYRFAHSEVRRMSGIFGSCAHIRATSLGCAGRWREEKEEMNEGWSWSRPRRCDTNAGCRQLSYRWQDSFFFIIISTDFVFLGVGGKCECSNDLIKGKNHFVWLIETKLHVFDFQSTWHEHQAALFQLQIKVFNIRTPDLYHFTRSPVTVIAGQTCFMSMLNNFSSVECSHSSNIGVNHPLYKTIIICTGEKVKDYFLKMKLCRVDLYLFIQRRKKKKKKRKELKSVYVP